jgi:hypothetical protein
MTRQPHRYYPDVILRCACSEIIMKARSEDEQVVRAKVVIIKGNFAYAVCKGCKQEVELPLKGAAGKRSTLGPKLYLDK